MKKHLTLIVSLSFLLVCSIEIGSNLNILLNQDVDSVLYIETNQGGATSTTQEELLHFDYSIDDDSEVGIKM